MNTPPRILLDNNILIDLFIDNRQGSRASRELFALIDADTVELLYGASKLETIFYIIRQSTKQMLRSEKGALTESDADFALRYAWGCIDNIREMATAVGVDEADLWYAGKCRSINGDLEDNMLLAGAKRAQADYLVTWDEGLIQRAGAVVRAVTPPVMATILREGL